MKGKHRQKCVSETKPNKKQGSLRKTSLRTALLEGRPSEASLLLLLPIPTVSFERRRAPTCDLVTSGTARRLRSSTAAIFALGTLAFSSSPRKASDAIFVAGLRRGAGVREPAGKERGEKAKETGASPRLPPPGALGTRLVCLD